MNTPMGMIFSLLQASMSLAFGALDHLQAFLGRSARRDDENQEELMYRPGRDDILRPYLLDIVLESTVDEETQERHTWNPNDRSVNVFIRDDDKFTTHRYPVAQSTDCVRGLQGYSSGFHVWSFEYPQSVRGTHAVVGVGTKDTPLHAIGYTQLLGQTQDSYGWDLIRCEFHHNSINTTPHNYPLCEVSQDFVVPDKFYMILDMTEGYVAFATDHEFYGIAYRGLKGKVLYPMASAVWGYCRVTMKYEGSVAARPVELREICRRCIREQLGRDRLELTDSLPLPRMLNLYVKDSRKRNSEDFGKNRPKMLRTHQ